jgi:drug/metabolite transporter (DMT)-like permease
MSRRGKTPLTSYSSFQDMDRLTRYLVIGPVLIVLGVGMVTLGISGVAPPAAGSLYILGLIAIVLGLIMVVGALWIDLAQLNRERSRPSPPGQG